MILYFTYYFLFLWRWATFKWVCPSISHSVNHNFLPYFKMNIYNVIATRIEIGTVKVFIFISLETQTIFFPPGHHNTWLKTSPLSRFQMIFSMQIERYWNVMVIGFEEIWNDNEFMVDFHWLGLQNCSKRTLRFQNL